ncbi:MAG: SRPBCC family protein [Chloroflexi bacterium]|nr:SRPBCC family protein [Chloroflexota bacterium]
MPVLERETVIPAPRPEVFAFFEDPRNLEKLTPKAMDFSIREIDDLPVKPGFRIAYTIKWLFLPIRWVTIFEEYDPPRGFTDVQAKGPYRLWRHEHSFEDLGDRTLMRDRVQYELPFGILGSIAHRLIVARQLKHIFDYRARRIRKLFAESGTPAA